MAPKDKDKIKYKDHKAIRVQLDEDTEYIAVILEGDIDLGVSVGASLEAGISGKVSGARKTGTVLAHYVKDKTLGLLPPDVWAEKKRQEVAGTLSPHMNIPFTSSDVIITNSSWKRPK